ncbi:MAG: amidohydrolase family protein [Stagnimonas sp.]|nr:amidohydrolase family protein [Stagnimonas sp.]
MQWDVLIRNGMLFDGDGAAPRLADVAIKGREIAAIGSGLDAAQAADVVDAKGQWVLPGLFDAHTHLDLEVELDPRLPEVVRHGTTTVVVSNCSLGLAFGRQNRNGEEPIVDCFARVENMPKHVLEKAASKVDWSDPKGYLDHLATLPLGPNVVPMIPHSMLRAEVMGLKQSVSRHPTVEEMAQMESILDTSMQQGYAGFSTDALPFHYLANDPHRRTKIPSQWGSFAELKRLTNVVRAHGRVWQATPPKDNPLQVLRNFSLTSSRLWGKTLKVTAVAALDIATNASLAKLAMFLTRVLNSKFMGGHFRFQALAAPFRVWWDGPINPLSEEIAELRELNEPDLDDRAARLKLLNDSAFQARFRAMWLMGRAGFNLPNLLRLLKREQYAFSRRAEDITVDSGPVPPVWKGETLAAVHARALQWQATGNGARNAEEADHFARVPKGADEVDFMLHLYREYDTALRTSTLTANRDPALTEKLLFDPQVLPGFNDSGAHLTNMAFYDGNLRGLQMAQRHGVEKVAWHVRRLTRDPAEFFGVHGGRIAVGMPADVIVIDPTALARHDSEANTHYLWRPELAHNQMVNRSDGVVTTSFIAGRAVWRDQQFTKHLGHEKLGRVLLGNGGETTVADMPMAQAA